MLSARELSLNVRPYVLEIRQVVSHLVLHSWLLDPQQSTPTQTFYNSSVGFTYVSTDIIYKNIYMLLQDVQYLV